jgi:GMP synthase-like glutamine amidotransferase
MIHQLPIRVALLDLNNNVPNQGMTCLRQFASYYNGRINQVPLEVQVFDVRHKQEIPDLSFDIYISSGGPGSPFDGEGSAWEAQYFKLIENCWSFNQNLQFEKKYFFFICHSYQMMCRFFQLGRITKRKSKSFGITQTFKTEAGKTEKIFKGLANPFYVADFRDYQLTKPNKKMLSELGAEVLSIEKHRPQVPLERATMAIRLSPEMIGTQFHPEADAQGMIWHFKTPEKRRLIIKAHGEAKYHNMMRKLHNPKMVSLTHRTILPRFLKDALLHLRHSELVLQS